jgi:hypothetical protein
LIPAALVALALAAEPCGLPPLAAGPPPFATGEALGYDIDLFGMVKGAALELAVERPMSGGKVLPLRARARTDPSVENLLRLAAVAFSWVDARTLLPERYREEAEEDGVHKVSDARLSPAGPELELAFDVGGRKSTARFPRQAPVLDAVSAVYYLRSARLAAGDRYCLDLVARGRLWRVTATVAARVEKLDTAVGRVEAQRIDARATLADRPQEPARQMHLWIGTDPRRLFLAAVGDIDLGPVRATLTAARGTRR